jgi:hypothetical protein
LNGFSNGVEVGSNSTSDGTIDTDTYQYVTNVAEQHLQVVSLPVNKSKLVPHVILTGPTSVGVCSTLIIDASQSSGSGGREMAAVTWGVVCTDASSSAPLICPVELANRLQNLNTQAKASDLAAFQPALLPSRISGQGK